MLLLLILLLLVLVHVTEQKVSVCSAAVWLIAVCRETVKGDRCVFQAEVWNIDVAAKSSEYSDVQLSDGDVLPGRKVIDEHTKVVDAVPAGFTCYGVPYGIFLSCGFFCLLSFFPRLISAVADWMSTILPHMVWP